MLSARWIPLLAAGLAGCVAAPAPVTPDPALVQKIGTLMGGHPCAESIAGQVAAYGVGANAVASVYQQPVQDPNYFALSQRRVWVKLSGRPGSIVVQYDLTGCRIVSSYGADGAGA